MSKWGFLTFVDTEEYYRMAVLAALSGWLAHGIPTCIVNASAGLAWKDTPLNHALWEVGALIETGLQYDDKPNPFHREWQACILSPFEHTLKIDADMFFPTGLPLPLAQLEESPLPARSAVPYTIQYTRATSKAYRQTFVDNALPDVYSALFYFRKEQATWRFFDKVHDIFDGWSEERARLVPKSRPKLASTDVVYAMAASHLNMSLVAPDDLLRFVHVKTQLNWKATLGFPITEDWTQFVTHTLTDSNRLLIGGYAQLYPVHYYVKRFGLDYLWEKLCSSRLTQTLSALRASHTPRISESTTRTHLQT